MFWVNPVWLPLPNFWYQWIIHPWILSLDTETEHTIVWTTGLKFSVSLTTSFFQVTKPRETIMFFLMSLISCASWLWVGINEFLFSSVPSLPLSSHVYFDVFLFPLYLQCLAECLSHCQWGKVCQMNGSLHTHLPPCWTHSPNRTSVWPSLVDFSRSLSYILWLQTTGSSRFSLLSLSLIPLYGFPFFTHFTFLLLSLFICFRKWSNSFQGSG